MRSHTYTHRAARTRRTSPQRRTRFSFSCLLLWPTLSVLSFFLSHYLRLLLPSPLFSISSFLSVHMQSGFSSPAPTFLRPLLFPSLSKPLPPLPSLLPPPSLLLALFSVCRARGHYLSHSGHVRWNGGECSEQKQRELWGIVASSGRLGNSAALSPAGEPPRPLTRLPLLPEIVLHIRRVCVVCFCLSTKARSAGLMATLRANQRLTGEPTNLSSHRRERLRGLFTPR